MRKLSLAMGSSLLNGTDVVYLQLSRPESKAHASKHWIAKDLVNNVP